jgi:hypothetical protein
VVQVDPVYQSNFSKYDIGAGYYITQADYQINLQQDAYYTHEVIDVVSFGGITNASQIAITYDSSYQELFIHFVHVIRDGKTLDRTADVKLEILNQEENLHMGIYSGQITTYAILDDIRKDDHIDMAYTLVGENPIFEDEKYLFIPLESMNPIDKLTIRIIYPLEDEYIYECIGCDETLFKDTIMDHPVRLFHTQ